VGTYGFDAIGASLELIEVTLKQMLEGMTPGTEENWAQMRDALARARTSLQQDTSDC
jgi:hypothetical protein